jgi:AmmeMemoRadiSam system protein B
MSLRRAAVAGTWYPSAPARLAADVASYIENADRAQPYAVPDAAEVVAIVAPHAGLVYSGGVAAHAYRLLQSRSYDVLVLVGPSHYVAFDGASIWPRGAFETPLGHLLIDEETAEAIAAANAVVQRLPAAHAREHSLEMQLPFIAALASATPIVPIVMGQQTRETAFDVADALSTALAGRRAMLVASSDLSHFYDARTATGLDRQVIDRVAALDPEGLMDLLERRPDHACGGGPMVSVMRAARALGASSASVVKYGDSGDVSGDKSSVVGYMAAALWR